MIAEPTVREDVLRLHRSNTRWLSTGWAGGRSIGPAAYNISVPEGWDCNDIESYVDGRLDRAGFAGRGPVLLTGVDLDHARGARAGPVEVYATAGLSNPAALPMETVPRSEAPSPANESTARDHTGTVNLIVVTTRALTEAALSNLIAVAAEAKAATLLAETGFPGTTTDAVVVACDSAGEPAMYSGSATPVGAATRRCVREAIRASLASRYADTALPASVADAEYGVFSDTRADVFRV